MSHPRLEALHDSSDASGMDSLDAQCLIFERLDAKTELPDLWRHERSGALSCAYSGGTQTFTWPPEDVAEMAQQWRDSDQSDAPEAVRSFLDAHQRLEAEAKESGLRAADVVLHDFGRAEVRAVWESEKVILVVEEVGLLPADA